MTVLKAAENYLETIYILSKRIGELRAIDIANELNYSKPTISIAMRNLRTGGYIDIDASNHITLTPKGLAIAERIYDRHVTLANLFIAIGVDEKTAFDDACKIEHEISEETFQKVKEHYQKEHA